MGKLGICDRLVTGGSVAEVTRLGGGGVDFEALQAWSITSWRGLDICSVWDFVDLA